MLYNLPDHLQEQHLLQVLLCTKNYNAIIEHYKRKKIKPRHPPDNILEHIIKYRSITLYTKLKPYFTCIFKDIEHLHDLIYEFDTKDISQNKLLMYLITQTTLFKNIPNPQNIYPFIYELIGMYQYTPAFLIISKYKNHSPAFFQWIFIICQLGGDTITDPNADPNVRNLFLEKWFNLHIELHSLPTLSFKNGKEFQDFVENIFPGGINFYNMPVNIMCANDYTKNDKDYYSYLFDSFDHYITYYNTLRIHNPHKNYQTQITSSLRKTANIFTLSSNPKHQYIANMYKLLAKFITYSYDLFSTYHTPNDDHNTTNNKIPLTLVIDHLKRFKKTFHKNERAFIEICNSLIKYYQTCDKTNTESNKY